MVTLRDFQNVQKGLNIVRQATGIPIGNGSDQSREDRKVSTDMRTVAVNTTQIQIEGVKQGRLDQYGAGTLNPSMTGFINTDSPGYMPNNNGRGIINRGGYTNFPNVPDYSPRVDSYSQSQAQMYSQRIQFQQANPAQPYNPINGELTAVETKNGLKQSGILDDPTKLQDFVNDMQKVIGPNIPLTYPAVENGQNVNKLSMDNLALALNQYVRARPAINMAQLEAGAPNAWLALDAFLDADEQRMGGVATAPAPLFGAPAAPAPAQKTYEADIAVATNIGKLLKDESPEKRKKMSEQVTAALMALGVKVDGSPIEELSGWIAKEKPALAEKMKNGTPAEAAAALRQATGELDMEANRALTLQRINAVNTPAMVTGAPIAPVEIITEAELVASIERASNVRGGIIDRVSDIKQHLNKLIGSNFKDDDNVDELGFKEALTKTLNQNLDPYTLRDLKNGGAFNVEGTFNKIEENMKNRADIEANRELFERGMNDGAMKQITHALTREPNSHVRMIQDLRKIGYDNVNGLEGSLREYLSDKLYNQQDFRSAPPAVKNFIKAVEDGKYKDSFPLANPENAQQMKEVLEYVEKSISLDIAKKEQGLPVGKAANFAPQSNAVPNASMANNVAIPTLGDGGATHFERTLNGVVDSSKWAAYMIQTSIEGGKRRLIQETAAISDYAKANNQPAKPEVQAEVVSQKSSEPVKVEPKTSATDKPTDVSKPVIPATDKANVGSETKTPAKDKIPQDDYLAKLTKGIKLNSDSVSGGLETNPLTPKQPTELGLLPPELQKPSLQKSGISIT